MSQITHNLLNRCGLEVRLLKNLEANQLREREYQKNINQLAPWKQLSDYKFKTIFDIGANSGQFVDIAKRLFPDAHVYSFEPLPDVFEQLKQNQGSQQNITPVNLGLSDCAKTLKMYRSAFSPSSSFLPMAELHRSEWPQSTEQTLVDVQVVRLDDWVQDNSLKLEENTLIKIDVQGHELSVIKGGLETCKKARFIVAEVSFYPLYEQQPLFDEVYESLRDIGFIYRGNIEQHYSQKHQRILFADALFENLNC